MKQKVIAQKHKIQKGPIDWLVYVGAVVEPVMTIPQIHDTWTSAGPSGSVITWAGYFIFAVIWLVYAVKYRITPLIVTELLWVLFQGLVVVGLLVRN